MQPDFIIFQILILIISVVIHEVSHGYVAQMMGDPTARLQGRLTLNPLKHLDPLGSVIIPGILLLSGSGFLIGWAKPVPYNPYNLSNQKWGEALVAGAGPAVNILLAVIFAIVIRVGMGAGVLSMVVALSASAAGSADFRRTCPRLFGLLWPRWTWKPWPSAALEPS